MSPLEIFGWSVTLLTVIALLLSRRSEHAERNFPHYSPSSQHTEARQSLIEPGHIETDRTFHVSYCQHCGRKDSIPLSETALEHGPWRITWRCHNCRKLSRASVPPPILETLRGQDRPGGMRISIREWREFAAKLADLDEAMREELL